MKLARWAESDYGDRRFSVRLCAQKRDGGFVPMLLVTMGAAENPEMPFSGVREELYELADGLARAAEGSFRNTRPLDVDPFPTRDTLEHFDHDSGASSLVYAPTYLKANSPVMGWAETGNVGSAHLAIVLAYAVEMLDHPTEHHYLVSRLFHYLHWPSPIAAGSRAAPPTHEELFSPVECSAYIERQIRAREGNSLAEDFEVLCAALCASKTHGE